MSAAVVSDPPPGPAETSVELRYNEPHELGPCQTGILAPTNDGSTTLVRVTVARHSTGARVWIAGGDWTWTGTVPIGGSYVNARDQRGSALLIANRDPVATIRVLVCGLVDPG